MKPNKGDQFFADIITKQYQKRTGERKEEVKLFAEVFDIAVEFTMLQFRQSYHEIFNELPRKNSEEFYKMIFESSSKGLLENTALPPCLTKDFYDGNLDEIRTGGRSANIIRNLEILIDEEKEGELASLAGSWGIIEPEWKISDSIPYTLAQLKCSSIPDAPIDFDKRVFTELLRENLSELVFYLETKLGFRPPLRDITNEEKAELGLKWADKVKTVRFAEDTKLSDTSGDLAAKEASNMLQGVIVHGEGKIAEPKVRK